MKKLIKDYENWFLKLRDSKKHWPKSCEDIYYDSIENIRKLLKKTEKDFYLDIDKEISGMKIALNARARLVATEFMKQFGQPIRRD